MNDLRALLSDPERRRGLVLGGGGAIIALLLALILWPDGQPDAPPAPSAPAAPAPADTAPSAEAYALPPPPVTDPTPAPAPAAVPEGDFVLHGIFKSDRGDAALLAFPDGRQRLVETGRMLLPGLILQSVGRDHVLLESADGTTRVDLIRAGSGDAPEASPSTSSPAAEVARGQSAQEVEAARIFNSLRLALEPAEDGRGYRVQPGARASGLAAAMLEPGDLIIEVNSDSFVSEERISDLAAGLAAGRPVELIVQRRGEWQRLQIPAR